MPSQDVVAAITQLANALQEPWCTRMKEHLQEECNWVTTREHGIKCTVHDVVVAPAPHVAPPSEVFKDTRQVVPFLISMMAQLAIMRRRGADE